MRMTKVLVLALVMGVVGLTTVALAATITGTSHDDVLIGTPSKDTIKGLGGNDKIWGLAGKDTIVVDVKKDDEGKTKHLVFIGKNASEGELVGAAAGTPVPEETDTEPAGEGP